MGVAAFVGLHLLVLIALAATAWAAGRVALAALRLETAGPAEAVALPVAAGLAVLGHGFFVLGAAGLLSRWSVVAVAAGVHLLALPHWRALLRVPRGPKWPWLVIVLTPVFVQALYPPLAFDETLYHLPMARAFAESGAMPFVPELRLPVLPPLAELWAAALLLLAGDVATHLVQLVATLAVAGLLLAWGKREGSPIAGWLAAALFLGGPIVVYQAGTLYVEPLLALCTTAAFFSVRRYLAEGARGWLLAAGFFAGSAAAVKVLGLLAVAGVGLTLLLAPGPRRWRRALGFGAVAAVFLAPTYARIAALTGNPLFPLLPEVFGSTPWDPVPAGRATGVGEALSRVATLPWDVFARRPRVGWQPPFTPWLLAVLPVIAFAAVRDRLVRWLAGVACLWLVLYTVLPPDVRYLLAPWPLVALAAAIVTARWLAGRGRLAVVLGIAFLLPGWLYAGWRVAGLGLPPSTAAAREALLAAKHPLYPAIAWLNRTEGRGYTLYAFHAEHMAYYVKGKHLGDWSGPARYARFEPLLADPPVLHRALRELGADFVLAAPGRIAEGPLFRRAYRDAAAEVFALSSPPAGGFQKGTQRTSGTPGTPFAVVGVLVVPWVPCCPCATGGVCYTPPPHGGRAAAPPGGDDQPGVSQEPSRQRDHAGRAGPARL